MDGLGLFGKVSPQLLDLAKDVSLTPSGYVDNPWMSGIGYGATTELSKFRASFLFSSPIANFGQGILIIPETTIHFTTCFGEYPGSLSIRLYPMFGNVTYEKGNQTVDSKPPSTHFQRPSETYMHTSVLNNIERPVVTISKSEAPAITLPMMATFVVPRQTSVLYSDLMNDPNFPMNDLATYYKEAPWNCRNLGVTGDINFTFFCFSMPNTYTFEDTSQLATGKRFLAWRIDPNSVIRAKFIPLTALL